MPAELFDIIFSGKLLQGQDPEQTREGVRRLFKASDTQLQRLFSGKPVSIKKAVNMETAGRYRAALRNLGALVDIRPSAVPSTATISSPADGLTLAPANTGSLEEYAPKLESEDLPDISGLVLAAAGTEMEEPSHAPPAHISTDGLDLVAGQDWSLEDCQPADLPQVMPDIDDLSLAARDDESHIPPEPPPLPLPDISTMELEEHPELRQNAEDV